MGADPYWEDSSGDGWTILQDYQNGYVPGTWNTPPAPQGLTVSYNSGTGDVSVNWQPSPGPVTGYTLEKYDPMSGATDVPVSATTYTENVPNAPSSWDGNPTIALRYRAKARYFGGDSGWSDPA